MTDELAPIRRAFGPDDLRPLLERRGIDRTVLVQTRSSVDETRELLATAAATDFVAGVVGWVDLAAPDVADALDALLKARDGRWLVGIRHQVSDEPDPRWLARADVRRGLRAVEAAGLAYDLLLRPRDLPAALEVAREHTGLRLVVDHIAKPRIRDGADPEWAERMAPLSDLPHVHCKVSGLVTEADWERWEPGDLAPFVRSVLGWFGAGRLMLGSDWPVCLVAAPYRRVLEVARQLVAGLPDAVRGENAVRFYGLPDPR